MKNTPLIVVFVLLGIIAIGGYFYPEQMSQVVSSSAGATFNTAKFAAVVVNLGSPGANATSSSVLNSDANPRYVTGFRVGCNGLGTSLTAYSGTGLASLQLTIGTSSSAAPAGITSPFKVASGVVIATSSLSTGIASSSSSSVGFGNAALWQSGEYMSFTFNATNTAACTVGVDYVGS